MRHGESYVRRVRARVTQGLQFGGAISASQTCPATNKAVVPSRAGIVHLGEGQWLHVLGSSVQGSSRSRPRSGSPGSIGWSLSCTHGGAPHRPGVPGLRYGDPSSTPEREPRAPRSIGSDRPPRDGAALRCREAANGRPLCTIVATTPCPSNVRRQQLALWRDLRHARSRCCAWAPGAHLVYLKPPRI